MSSRSSGRRQGRHSPRCSPSLTTWTFAANSKGEVLWYCPSGGSEDERCGNRPHLQDYWKKHYGGTAKFPADQFTFKAEGAPSSFKRVDPDTGTEYEDEGQESDGSGGVGGGDGGGSSSGGSGGGGGREGGESTNSSHFTAGQGQSKSTGSSSPSNSKVSNGGPSTLLYSNRTVVRGTRYTAIAQVLSVGSPSREYRCCTGKGYRTLKPYFISCTSTARRKRLPQSYSCKAGSYGPGCWAKNFEK